jgi:hypothetical protein
VKRSQSNNRHSGPQVKIGSSLLPTIGGIGSAAIIAGVGAEQSAVVQQVATAVSGLAHNPVALIASLVILVPTSIVSGLHARNLDKERNAVFSERCWEDALLRAFKKAQERPSAANQEGQAGSEKLSSEVFVTRAAIRSSLEDVVRERGASAA